ncbi:MFS transporter [Streptomyces sp. ESR1.13]|uniref:MFS transporter n=1 Tax=Streptomyces TaxID=1883 RepID=UPI0006E26C22|nr:MULTISPECIES: MFS transporter [Streptomyces]MCL7369298.1 MHS family MFS transporter [Streptomyces ardesiacus]NEB61011.1 MHS family MFS transporter [Streptomyces diastaticus]
MSPTTPHKPAAGPQSIRKIAIASLTGTALEWYDFFLYGTASALVLGTLFFPEASSLAGTLASFGTFAVGFAARPLGGIVFGHFGDRLGRKPMLVITLLVMGFTTFLIGALPTYAQIGVWAPILLTLLRVLQGIAVGGEWGGSVLMITEHAPAGRRGFYSAWSQVGINLGFVTSAGVFAAVQAMSDEAFLSWGWRIPFLLGAVPALVGLVIRLKIEETPEFQSVQHEGEKQRLPLLHALKTHPRSILITAGARMAENGASYIFLVFSLAYGKHIGVGNGLLLTGIIVANVVEGASMVGFGALSDRIGRRPVYMAGAVTLVLFAFPFFWLLDTGTPVLVWLALVVAIGIGHGAMIGTQPSFFTELFGKSSRYSAISLGHELASVFAGGLSPLIATALLAATDSSWPISLYIVVLGCITLVSVYFARETVQRDVPPTPAPRLHPAGTHE